MHTKWLATRTILLTRPGGISEQLKKNISEVGGRALYLPSMLIKPAAHQARAKQLLAGLTGFDILIFISRNAVKYACEIMPDIAGRTTGKSVFAIGSGSYEALQSAGFSQVTYTNSNTGSEALLALQELQQEHVQNRRIMIIRGEGGRELLAKNLLARGAKIQYVELYRRTRPRIEPDIISDTWLIEKPDAVVVTSAEGLSNLLEMTVEEERRIFLKTPLVVFSPRLKSIAESLGFNAAIKVVRGYSEDDLMLTLKELFEAKEDE